MLLVPGYRDHMECPMVTTPLRRYRSNYSLWSTLHRLDPFQREFRRSLHNVCRFIPQEAM